MHSLNVAMVTRRRPSALGGVERVVSGLLSSLAQDRPDWQVDSVSAFRRDTWVSRIAGISDVVASLRLGWRLRATPADVVFVHCPECLWGIRLLRRRRRAGPAVVAVWHGAGARRWLILRRPGHPLAYALALLRTMEELAAVAADGHVAVHESVAGDLRSVYRLDKPVTVIGNAVDVRILHRLARSERVPDGSGLTALWLGQAGYAKGLDVALAAVAEARRKLPHLRLVAAGVPAGEPAEGVEWRGQVAPAQVAELYRQADLFIFPSRYESFGLVVIEAMAAGLPVIVSDDVPAGIVTDGRNGVVIRGHDPSRYAAALGDLADARVRAAMARANVEDVRFFSAAAMSARYVAVAESFAGIQ